MAKTKNEDHADWKTKWIIGTLKHTKEKDYENYIITGIWHRLVEKKIELKPVTQQYVRREDGYALLDMYFPDINLAIECDERQHFVNKQEHTENDIKRQDEVLRELGALESGPELIRIDATKSIKEIDNCIEDAVRKIIEKYDKCGRPVWNYIDPVKFVQQKGEISVNDNLLFRTTADVLNALGARTHKGTAYGQWATGLARINDGRLVWFPNMTTDKNADKKWKNLLIDPKHIVEKSYNRETPDDVWRQRNEDYDNKKPARYLVFAKVKNALGECGYRFFGTFEMEGYNIEKSPFITKWKRVKTEEMTIK